MPKRNIQPVKKGHSKNNNFNFFLIGAVIIVCPLLAVIFLRETSNGSAPKESSDGLIATKTPCQTYFFGDTYNTHGMANTVLIGEIHRENEERVASCLETLAKPGDHLLIEFPNEGKEISCGSRNKTYERFNGKLKCYGVDVPSEHENRRMHSDLTLRTNMIGKFTGFLSQGKSSQQALSAMNKVIDSIENIKAVDVDPEFYKRNAKFLKKIVKSMSGLSSTEMRNFLVKENNRLADKADAGEKKSGLGSRNYAFVEEILSHREQLQGGKSRLFAILGNNHATPELNPELNEKIIKKGMPVTILQTQTIPKK